MLQLYILWRVEQGGSTQKFDRVGHNAFDTHTIWLSKDQIAIRPRQHLTDYFIL